jgi:hypothetical protein
MSQIWVQKLFDIYFVLPTINIPKTIDGKALFANCLKSKKFFTN